MIVNNIKDEWRKLLRQGFSGLVLALVVSHSSLAHHTSTPEEMTDELRGLLINAIDDSESFEDKYDAEVWLLSQSHKLRRYIDDPEERLYILRHVHREAKRAELEPELVLAVIQIESAFNPYAVSVVGAQGMMQVMPFWKNEIGRPDDNLIDMKTNLRYGCTILKHYLDREKGGLPNALARYNGSYGSFKYSKKVMDAWIDRWR